MAGIRLADRLLVVGCSDPLLIARLAVKTGLTGRAYALDEREPLVAAARDVAAREGALIETATGPWTTFPLDTDTFDVAIVRNVLPYLPEDRRGACLDEVRRVLRPGGRCLVIDGGGRTGLAALTRRGSVPREYRSQGGAVQIFTALGFKAARILAERDGFVFAEAVKAMVPSQN